MIGVIVGAFLPERIHPEVVWLYGCMAFILFLTVVLWFITKGTRKLERYGLVLFPLLLVMGFALAFSCSDQLFITDPVSTSKHNVYLARVVEQPKVTENSVRIEAELATTDLARRAKALLYFDVDSLSSMLEFDDVLVLRTDLNEVEPVGNPNEFNYPRYLRFHNIHHRGRVDSAHWQLLQRPEVSMLRTFHRWRAAMIAKLKEARLNDSELSVASALILGYRVDVDRDLMTAYAGAGATHVLAVSGLHVGIVYIIFQWMLSFMDRSKRWKLVKLIVLIALLALYAALTGFSPSVNRAAFMFAFVAIGKYIDRRTNIFNTLAVSALVLMLVNPLIVMEVGFQLSYLAVIGIVLIHPVLFGKLVFKNRIADWVWNITCVSLSAQIATFPLGLLYFHQFPLLFMVSNLVVIPAAGVILYLGFALFLFSWFKPLFLVFGFVLESIIWALNRSVVAMNSIPHAVYSGLDISIFESVVIYLIIASVLVVVYRQKVWAVASAIALVIVLVVSQTLELDKQNAQRSITVYNVKGETAVALIEATTVRFIGPEELRNDENRMLFHVKHHWWNRGADQITFTALTDSVFNRVIDWRGTRFAILNVHSRVDGFTQTDSLDFVIVDRVGWKAIEQLANLPTTRIIVSNTLGPKTRERLVGIPGKKVEFVEYGAIQIDAGQ
jgi:competence protein ComEC